MKPDCTAVNENGHMFCEQCKQSWPLNDPNPKPCQLASRDEKEWCRYIAGMIGQYLGEPLGSDKEKAIAGIIERRMWNLSRSTHRDAQPAVAQEPVDLRELFERLLFGTYAGKDSYYNEEQIKHGCFEKAQELADVAKRMDIMLYTEAPAVAQEPVALPRFNCWSANEGDTWFDHPADAQIIEDCLGSEPKVGDEYEVLAGWRCVTARYKIISQDGDDFEVACLSHPKPIHPAPAVAVNEKLLGACRAVQLVLHPRTKLRTEIDVAIALAEAAKRGV